MTTTPSTRRLLRVVSSLLLAITATMLSVGSAHAETAITGRGDTVELDTAAARPTTISVLLAADHIVLRCGMRAVLTTQPDMNCVAEAADATAIVRDLRRLRPDVTIIDLDLPGLTDPATLDAIATSAATTRLLTLTTSESDENLYRALRLGTSAFLPKSVPAHDLVTAVRTTAHGHPLVNPHLTRRLITRLTHGGEPFPAAPELKTLTPREHQVLRLIAQAHTNPEIARTLGVGEQTVKTHVSNILAKLSLRDRVHAAIYAHTHHLL